LSRKVNYNVIIPAFDIILMFLWFRDQVWRRPVHLPISPWLRGAEGRSLFQWTQFYCTISKYSCLATNYFYISHCIYKIEMCLTCQLGDYGEETIGSDFDSPKHIHNCQLTIVQRTSGPLGPFFIYQPASELTRHIFIV